MYVGTSQTDVARDAFTAEDSTPAHLPTEKHRNAHWIAHVLSAFLPQLGWSRNECAFVISEQNGIKTFAGNTWWG
jgi:hypothetical protein